jgi:hypothetical protein
LKGVQKGRRKKGEDRHYEPSFKDALVLIQKAVAEDESKKRAEDAHKGKY